MLLTLPVQTGERRGSVGFFFFVQTAGPAKRTPSQGPWLLSPLLKAFPQPEIKPSAQRQTSGRTDSRPGSNKMAWREKRREHWHKEGEGRWQGSEAGWVWEV